MQSMIQNHSIYSSSHTLCALNSLIYLPKILSLHCLTCFSIEIARLKMNMSLIAVNKFTFFNNKSNIKHAKTNKCPWKTFESSHV